MGGDIAIRNELKKPDANSLSHVRFTSKARSDERITKYLANLGNLAGPVAFPKSVPAFESEAGKTHFLLGTRDSGQHRRKDALLPLGEDAAEQVQQQLCGKNRGDTRGIVIRRRFD